MAKHHPDLIMCRKQPGNSVGLLCQRCEGRCVVCDSFVNSKLPVHVCDECTFGKLSEKCIVCGGKGVSAAFYCAECVLMEKESDGCPRIVNIGTNRADLFYERKKFKVR
eukprot:g1147.t1